MCETRLDITNVAAPPPPFNEEDMEMFVQKVYMGMINKYNLDEGMYAKTISYLMAGVRDGFGGLYDEFTYGSGLSDVSMSLEANIYRFSAAKQYQEVRVMSKLAFRAVSFDEFKEVASVVFDEFNRQYLLTEYVTAVQQGQTARDWVDFTENEFITMLRYRTEGDGRVRPEHAALNNIVLPKDDPFWSTYYPANGWNCRCFVEGLEQGRKTDLSKKNIPEWGDEGMPQEFKYNPGKDGLIFSNQHPYFKIAPGDADLKRNNFNLPLP